MFYPALIVYASIHQNSYGVTEKNVVKSMTKSMSSALNMLLQNLKVDPKLKDEVFPRMRSDEISLQAKIDPLICPFGTRYITSHREKHLAIVASRKMRELAKLLIETKKCDNSIKTLFDILHLKYFDKIVSTTKVIAKYNRENDKFESPTLAINMGTMLKQCCDITIIFVVKRSLLHNSGSRSRSKFKKYDTSH